MAAKPRVKRSTQPAVPDWRANHATYRDVIEQVGTTGRLVVVCGAVIWVAYIAQQAVVLTATELAGKTTSGNIVVDVIHRLDVSITLAWGWAAAATLWGYNERRLKKRTIKHLQRDKRAREDGIDPERTSSELADDGSNNPEDD